MHFQAILNTVLSRIRYFVIDKNNNVFISVASNEYRRSLKSILETHRSFSDIHLNSGMFYSKREDDIVVLNETDLLLDYLFREENHEF